MGWKSSQEFDKTSEDALVFKSVMVKTRKEKGKESELHVANGKVVKKLTREKKKRYVKLKAFFLISTPILIQFFLFHGYNYNRFNYLFKHVI